MRANKFLQTFNKILQEQDEALLQNDLTLLPLIEQIPTEGSGLFSSISDSDEDLLIRSEFRDSSVADRGRKRINVAFKNVRENFKKQKSHNAQIINENTEKMNKIIEIVLSFGYILNNQMISAGFSSYVTEPKSLDDHYSKILSSYKRVIEILNKRDHENKMNEIKRREEHLETTKQTICVKYNLPLDSTLDKVREYLENNDHKEELAYLTIEV